MRSRPLLLPLLLAIAPAALASRPVRAAEPPAAPDANDAHAHLRRGVELRKAHFNEGALAEFQRAYAAEPSAIAMAQIGLAEQALGRWVDAERDLGKALDASGDAWIAQSRGQLEAAMAVIRSNLGAIEVRVTPSDATVTLDGRPLRPGEATRAAAGPSVLRVEAPGRRTEMRRIEIAAGREPTRVAIELVADAAPSPSTTPATSEAPTAQTSSPGPPRDEPPSRVGPLTLGAVGVVSIGIGAYLGLRAIGDKSDRDANCSALGCNPTGLAADASARGAATGSTVAFTLGAASLGAGVAWFLLQRAPHPAGVSIAPIVGPDVAGLWVTHAL